MNRRTRTADTITMEMVRPVRRTAPAAVGAGDDAKKGGIERRRSTREPVTTLGMLRSLDQGEFDRPRQVMVSDVSLHGEGEETVEVTKLNGTKETLHTFGWYMRKYGNDARAKGATAIFCSMVPHKDWQNGKIVRKESETFVRWTANAAKATGAAFIDLNEIVALEFERLGVEKVAPLFGDARTHSTPAGARLNAELVIAGIRSLKNPNLKKFLSESGRSIRPAPISLVASGKYRR